MKRHELEHILRASGSITNHSEFVVLGSQAILGLAPDVPQELLLSNEVDICVPEHPDLSSLVEGSIGELSPFHETFGYYAHGIELDSAILPLNWRKRLIALRNENTGGVTGYCLNPLDIAISKLAAGREKDVNYVTAMLNHQIVQRDEVEQLLSEVDEQWQSRIKEKLHGIDRR